MVRKAIKEDAESIAKIIYDSWKVTYKGIIQDEYLKNMSLNQRVDKWKKYLASENSITTYIYEENNKISGVIKFGESEENNNIGEIYVLYVDITKKRKGIGKKLFNYAIEQFKKQRYENVILWCAKGNLPSIEFYKKMGGQIVAQRTFTIDNIEIEEVGIKYDILTKN